MHWLVEILAEMTLDQQRGFLMFVTGCPCLPVGGASSHHASVQRPYSMYRSDVPFSSGSAGLRGCNPRLTVVMKVLEGHYRSLGQAAIDAMLPSASTCTNYLKLPEYSSKDIMRQKLLYSISHGQNSFHMS